MSDSNIVFLARRLQEGDDIVSNEAIEGTVTERYDDVHKGLIEFELEPAAGDDPYSLSVVTDVDAWPNTQNTTGVHYSKLVIEEMDTFEVTSLKVRDDDGFIQVAKSDYDAFIGSN